MITNGCIKIQSTGYYLRLVDTDYKYVMVNGAAVAVDRLETAKERTRPFHNWREYMTKNGYGEEAKRVQRRQWALEKLGVNVGNICLGFKVDQ